MSRFEYQALDKSNNIVEGSIEANSLREARQKICDMDLLPTDIRFDGAGTLKSTFDSTLDQKSKGVDKPLRLASKTLFVSEMQTMLSSGLSILEALNVLNRPSLENKDLRILVNHVQGSIMNGSTFTEALKPFTKALGPVIVGLIAAGEGSGKLVVTLERAKILLKKEQKIKSYIKRVSIYPCIMMSVALLLLFVMGLWAIPRLKSMPSDADIPSFAEAVMAIPNFLLNNWFLVLLTIFGFIGFCFYFFSLESVRRKIDEILLKIPKFSDFIRYINLSNYFAVLAETYDSDVPIAEAFDYSAKAMDNSVMRDSASKLVPLATRGATITDALVAFDYVDDNFITSIAAGEKSGELTQKFAEISVVIDEHIEAITETLLNLYGPLTVLIVGVIVAIIAAAFYQSYFTILFGL